MEKQCWKETMGTLCQTPSQVVSCLCTHKAYSLQAETEMDTNNPTAINKVTIVKSAVGTCWRICCGQKSQGHIPEMAWQLKDCQELTRWVIKGEGSFLGKKERSQQMLFQSAPRFKGSQFTVNLSERVRLNESFPRAELVSSHWQGYSHL